jgi:WD40 repeat protein
MSRLFISHSSANNAMALALGGWLEANGWSDFFLDIDDSRGIQAGERWIAALAGAVDRCEAVIFLISPAWRDSKQCFAEFFDAKKLGKRIFGVIVEPVALAQLPEQMTAEWQVCDLTCDAASMPDAQVFTVSRPPLVDEAVIRFSRSGLEALARGLKKAGLDPATFVWPPAADAARAPYPGLRALDEADAAVFFGRDAAIVRAIDQIRLLRERNVERLFVVLGASGSGKSSFLRAGLLPRLRRDSDHFTVLQPVRPLRAVISGSQGVLAALGTALTSAGLPTSPATLRAQLQSDGLAGVLARFAAAPAVRPAPALQPTFVLPLDQSEELFSPDGAEEARQFIAWIDNLRQSAAGVRVLLVLTLRSDALPRLQEQVALQAMKPIFFSLPAMPAAEFKAVIEGPARRHTQTVRPLVFEPRLVDQLVADARGADALPLLALTLEWLYREFTDAHGTRLGSDEYERLGGMSGVIEVAVRRAFDGPNDAPAIPADAPLQQALLHRIFPYLATVDPDSGLGKRRVAVRSTLYRVAQADALLTRLIEQRLLVTDRRALDETTSAEVDVVEVAHEALLRQWETLRLWLAEFSAALAAAESVRRAAQDWRRHDCDEAALVHTAHRLRAAEVLLGDERLQGRFEPVDHDYVTACRQREQRQTEDREAQLRRIAEQQAARAALQRRVGWLVSSAALVVAGLAAAVVIQAREVSVQTSLVLAAAAETAADANRFERSARLAVLAARDSWLHPAHANAGPALSRAADGTRLQLLVAVPASRVNAALFSPNGRYVITGSADGKARLWDAQTGRMIGQPMEHDAPVVSADFSADGSRIVTASEDGSARIWNGASAAPQGRALTHSAGLWSARFNKDGSRVVTASADNTARVWDVATGGALGEPMRHASHVVSAVFDTQGVRIVTASRDGTARIWDAATGRPLGEALQHASAVTGASFSPDGGRVVTASQDKTARLWDAASGKPLGAPMQHSEAVVSAAFSTDGERVVTASADRTARVWNATDGKPTSEPMAHADAVVSARFSADRRQVVTASNAGMARLWDASTGSPASESFGDGDALTLAAFSADGGRVLTASTGGGVGIWRSGDDRTVGAAMQHLAPVAWAGFSADGARIVTAAADGTAQVWLATSGHAVGALMRHTNGVVSARFSPDGGRVVTASADGTARIWSAETGQPSGAPIVHAAAVWFADFSPDGRHVVTASEDRSARIWDAFTGMPAGPPMLHGEPVWHARYSADSRRVTTISHEADPVGALDTGSGSVARYWDVASGKELDTETLQRTPRAVSSASADGRRVVKVSNGVARVWDTVIGKPLSGPIGARLASADISGDGRRVVTASSEGTAQVWSGLWSLGQDPSRLAAALCASRLPGDVSRLTAADVRATPLLTEGRIGEDVCEGNRALVRP